MPTTHEISAEIVRRWDELARDGVINREETIRQIIQGMLDAAARCVYCNNLFKLNTPEEKEAIVKHVMSCDKNPMTEIYEESKKIVEADTKANEATNEYIALLEKNNAELERLNAAAEANVTTAMKFITNLRKAVRRAADTFGTVEVEYEKPEYYERVLHENTPA